MVWVWELESEWSALSGDLKVEGRRMKVNILTPRCHHRASPKDRNTDRKCRIPDISGLVRTSKIICPALQNFPFCFLY